jgi:dTMP kinase
VKGLFITLEGVDCCGKSTQAELLKHYLEKTSHPYNDVVLTEEPGGTPLGKTLRQLILHPKYGCYPASMTEIYLYMADRWQHIHEIIVPNLDAGNIVISSRFIDSIFAYQGYGRGINLDMLHLLNDFHGIAWPDITFLFDISEEEHLKRIRNKAHLDIMEQETQDFLRRVREGFIHCANNHERIIVLNGELPIGDVFNMLKTHVDRFLTC